MRVKNWVFYLFLLLIFSCSSWHTKRSPSSLLAKNVAGTENRPIVILISIDGFRYDYVKKFHPPLLSRWAKQETSARALIPVFPTITFPSHYSMVSGLYPGEHGIVDNEFYNRNLHLEYHSRNPISVQDGRFYAGTPLWNWVESEGMLATEIFWVGSEADIGGRFTRDHFAYDADLSYSTRVDEVIKRLQLSSEERPHFIALYFEWVDRMAHKFGPESSQVKEEVQRVDNALQDLVQRVDELNLQNSVNILVVSDHGLSNTRAEDTIDLNPYLQETPHLRVLSGGAIVHIYADELFPREIFQVEKKLRRIPHLKVYRKNRTPKRWHLNNHPALGDLMVVADPPYYLISGDKKHPCANLEHPCGVHGYDNRFKEMWGIFYARGPQMAKGVRKAFLNKDIYSLVQTILRSSSWAPTTQ